MGLGSLSNHGWNVWPSVWGDGGGEVVRIHDYIDYLVVDRRCRLTLKGLKKAQAVAGKDEIPPRAVKTGQNLQYRVCFRPA